VKKKQNILRQVTEDSELYAAYMLAKMRGLANQRVMFDPNNKDHISDYAYFIKYRNWKNGCHYILEVPFEDVPSMISSKLIRHFLKDELNNLA
jgi:hypothetical protein